MESVELYDVGTKVFGAFEGLLSLNHSNPFTGRHHLASEAQRFRLWAHSLGLHQLGHASLDYRVRDAVVVKNRLAEVLLGLQEHLENLLAIANGERLPYEQDVDADIDEDDDDASSVSIDAESDASEQTHSRSDESVHEVDFRLQSLTESLDALYSLATKIRNPRNRPQRTNNQLYKRIPVEIRTSFIEEREAAEIAVVAWTHRHHLIEEINLQEAVNSRLNVEELIDRYATSSNWLVRRMGIANARRKQQFVYWKDHALRLGRNTVRSKPTAPTVKHSTEDIRDEPAAAQQRQLAPSVAVLEKAALDAAPSLVTSATKLEADFVKPEDLKSVLSHQSNVSTIISVKGEKLEWPMPPTQITTNGYFTCPYCKILCPQRYLAENAWRVHLIHDLQPYHCTYQDCVDPHRLYGTRQEWIDHESQHSRVWHCQEHDEEFETRPDYVEHLKIRHPDITPEYFSPELIAAVVGPSQKRHRDCPFCPTAFSEPIEMQKHITFHLERSAHLALPLLVGDGSNKGDSSGRPSDSHEVQHHGRRSSVLGDFDNADEQSFKNICYRSNTPNYHHQNLTERNLYQIPTSSSGVSSSPVIWAWLEGLSGDSLAGEASIEWPSEYSEIGRQDGRLHLPWQDIADQTFLDQINADVPADTAADYLRIYQEAGGNQDKILQIIQDEGLEDRMRYWIPVTLRLSTARTAAGGDPSTSTSVHKLSRPPLKRRNARYHVPQLGPREQRDVEGDTEITPGAESIESLPPEERRHTELGDPYLDYLPSPPPYGGSFYASQSYFRAREPPSSTWSSQARTHFSF
ncbi:hypothetical protein Hte_010769 [Hypoxylon texense]